MVSIQPLIFWLLKSINSFFINNNNYKDKFQPLVLHKKVSSKEDKCTKGMAKTTLTKHLVMASLVSIFLLWVLIKQVKDTNN